MWFHQHDVDSVGRDDKSSGAAVYAYERQLQRDECTPRSPGDGMYNLRDPQHYVYPSRSVSRYVYVFMDGDEAIREFAKLTR